MPFLHRITFILYAVLAYVIFVTFNHNWLMVWNLNEQVRAAGHLLQPFFSVMANLPWILAAVVMAAMYHLATKRFEAGTFDSSSKWFFLAVIAYQIAGFILPSEGYVTSFLTGDWHQVTSNLILALIMAPVAEELLFRGLIPEGFRAAFGESLGIWIGVMISAVIFGLAHKQYNMPNQIHLMGLAVLFGYARIRSDGFRLPILLHSAAGAVAIIGGCLMR